MKEHNNEMRVSSTTANRFKRFLGINGTYTAKALDDIYADKILKEKEKEFFDSVYAVVYTEEEYNAILEKYCRPRKVKEYSDEVKRSRVQKQFDDLKARYGEELLKEIVKNM